MNYVCNKNWFANPVAQYHEEGLMRGVRIGRLEINPFAYNPMSGELKVIDNLEVEVRFLQSNHAKTDQLKKLYNSPAFNGLFVGLLNYSAPTREDVTVKEHHKTENYNEEYERYLKFYQQTIRKNIDK